MQLRKYNAIKQSVINSYCKEAPFTDIKEAACYPYLAYALIIIPAMIVQDIFDTYLILFSRRGVSNRHQIILNKLVDFATLTKSTNFNSKLELLMELLSSGKYIEIAGRNEFISEIPSIAAQTTIHFEKEYLAYISN
jgi:hypothetical protein